MHYCSDALDGVGNLVKKLPRPQVQVRRHWNEPGNIFARGVNVQCVNLAVQQRAGVIGAHGSARP